MTGTVLVVDASEDNRRLLADVMGRAGFGVLTACSGRQALECAPRADAVLLDVLVPDLPLAEVCALLRADPATAGLALLLIGAPDSRGHLRGDLPAGADGYVARPFSPSRLVAQIADALAARQRLSMP